jgi:hypothetical protein
MSCLQKNDEKINKTWHFYEVNHPFKDISFADIYTRSNGDVFVVGEKGFILEKKSGSDEFKKIESGTQENLTSIDGVENGDHFLSSRQQNKKSTAKPYGEMVVSGENAILLHYHPNPDQDFNTSDEKWSILSLGENKNVSIVDKNCMFNGKIDFDGDGVGDDGDESGYAGDKPCYGTENLNSKLNCDDNCVRVPNSDQKDANNNGYGDLCDNNETNVVLKKNTFKNLKIFLNNNQMDVWVLGNQSSIISYNGYDSSVRFRGQIQIQKNQEWKIQPYYGFNSGSTERMPGICGGGLCEKCIMRYASEDFRSIAKGFFDEILIVADQGFIFRAKNQDMKNKNPLESYVCEYASQNPSWHTSVFNSQLGYILTSYGLVAKVHILKGICQVELLHNEENAFWKDSYVDSQLNTWFVGLGGRVAYLDVKKVWHDVVFNQNKAVFSVASAKEIDGSETVWVAGSSGLILKGILE